MGVFLMATVQDEIRDIMRLDDLAHNPFTEAETAHLAPYMNEPYLWIEEVHNLIEPIQGFTTQNEGDVTQTTAILMMMLEGLLTYPDEPNYELNKVLFADICIKVWETNVREHELMDAAKNIDLGSNLRF